MIIHYCVHVIYFVYVHDDLLKNRSRHTCLHCTKRDIHCIHLSESYDLISRANFKIARFNYISYPLCLKMFSSLTSDLCKNIGTMIPFADQSHSKLLSFVRSPP